MTVVGALWVSWRCEELTEGLRLEEISRATLARALLQQGHPEELGGEPALLVGTLL